MDGRRVARHDVGPVDVPGDAPEAFRLALRDEAALRRVKAFELGVLLRDDARERLERAALGDVVHREPVRRDLMPGRAALQRYGNKLELFAVEYQGPCAGVAS